MSNIAINPVTRRVQFTGNTGTGPFAFTFNALQQTDIAVFKNNTLLTLTTNYSVSLNANGTGSVSLGVALISSDVLTIIGGRELSRTTDFVTAGDLLASSLNEQLDSNVIMAQQLDEKIERGLFLNAGDVYTNLELPVKDARKGTVLGFNATSGDPEAGPNITAVQSLANVTTSINILGTTAAVEDMSILGTAAIVEDMSILGTSGNVTAMGLLGVSAVVTDMGILGTAAIVEDMSILGTSGNVSAMALLGTSAAVADMAILGTSAIVADMAILGTDDVVADMAILGSSDVVTDMNLLATAAVIEDMGLLATSANVAAMGQIGTSANVTAMGLLGTSAVVTDMGILGTAAIVEDMALLGTSANVTSMGLLGTSAVVEDMGLLATSAVIEDMGLLATSTVIEDMGLLGTSANVTAMGNVSGSITNVNTVASNVAGVNSFAERYRIASSAPSSSLNVGDLYFDTSANELKVYKSSGWAAAGSTINGTSARFHYDITGTPTTVTGSDANSNTLAYDAGFIDVYVNGVRMSQADINTTSGSSVVFASALAAGDEVDIVAFGTFAVANIVATGALNSGSITSGFGTINNGASAITTTGVGSFGSLDISGAIDVDGVTNLDVVDIDGAVDMASTALVAGVLTANGGAVFNEASADVDFRVESDNLTHALFVQGSDGNVGIGCTPLSSLHVSSAGDTSITLQTTNAVDNNEIWQIQTAGNAINHADLIFRTRTNAGSGGSEVMRINATGAVTKPLQPAFLVKKNADQNDIAVDTHTTVPFQTEVFDTNADFASNTFTAPVAGKYLLGCSILFSEPAQDADYISIRIKTSNRDYRGSMQDYAGMDTALVYWSVGNSFVCDMDANDTVFVSFYQSSGTAQTNILESADTTNFYGYLLG